MLELLKNIGWVLLGFFSVSIGLIAVFRVFMVFGGYRWSIFSVKHYLKSHGRGCLEEENRFVIGVDLVTRMLWVLVFGVATIILGWVFMPSIPLKIGAILGASSFLTLVTWIEMHFTIRIGSVVFIDEREHVAYFDSLDGRGNSGFCLYFSRGREKYLKKDKKYLVSEITNYYALVDDYD